MSALSRMANPDHDLLCRGARIPAAEDMGIASPKMADHGRIVCVISNLERDWTLLLTVEG